MDLLQYESGFFSVKCMNFLRETKQDNLKATSGTNPSHSASRDKKQVRKAGMTGGD